MEGLDGRRGGWRRVEERRGEWRRGEESGRERDNKREEAMMQKLIMTYLLFQPGLEIIR